MSKTFVAFRARARTIDHLGKGQIADCPTAVSELWKNSYDAYARNVALHTFDGEFKCAAIIDDGCGMSLNQLIDSWLVVGTESKSTKKTLDAVDRFGLAPRKTQGEKGIGRLSSAFLAPVTLLITKKMDSPYSIALIDWRLFENTYLSLSDINVPIAELDSLDAFSLELPRLISQLRDNLCISPRADLSEERFREIQFAWNRFTKDQIELADRGDIKPSTTFARILDFCDNFYLDEKILATWKGMLHASMLRDGSEHGTGLFLLDLDRELALLTNPGQLSKENFEVDKIESDLIDTLRAFVDPFNSNEEEFKYEIKIFSIERGDRTLLRQTDVFNYLDFCKLEHVVEGSVDGRGWFNGRVKAFGKDMGQIKFAPSIEIDKNGTKVGPFSIKLGTFENEADKSSHTDTEFALLSAQTNKYTGLMIFRDGLRVLPYGRGDNDFFEIEERRGKNAGRYYWARRRIFGQILISQDENSLLRDKAGREGFIKNQAARELRALVEAILTALADRFFGKKSDARQELLAIVKKERDARKEAQTKARSQTQKGFASDLKRLEPQLLEQLNLIRKIQVSLEQAKTPNAAMLADFDADLQNFEAIRGELRTPIKPPKLGDYEDRYRSYRDMYGEFSAHVIWIKEALNKFESAMSVQFPEQVAKRHFDRNQALLSSQINKNISAIKNKTGLLLEFWEKEVRNDRALYYQRSIDFVERTTGENLEKSLNNIDSTYAELSDDFTVKYEAILRALDRLENGVNLDYAFSMAEEERGYFEKKAKDLQSLAQLGISVEILAHELDEMDSLVTSGLNSLPSDIKNSHPGFKIASDAHRALTQQIRFLSPLKISGYQIRREITGENIKSHILTFFGDRFSRQRIEIIFTDTFEKIAIKDLPSRIYPVFTNLINNALYWVNLSESRQIIIGVIGHEVLIANSGPPVDVDDVPRLFELFYTKRSNGHGVGLYLCRENLAVARHTIRYSAPHDPKLIEGGANFIITFNEMEISK